MAIAYEKAAVETAKKEGLHLVKLEINGKYAKRGSVSLSGTVGPKTAERLWELLKDLCNVKKRME